MLSGQHEDSKITWYASNSYQLVLRATIVGSEQVTRPELVSQGGRSYVA